MIQKCKQFLLGYRLELSKLDSLSLDAFAAKRAYENIIRLIPLLLFTFLSEGANILINISRYGQLRYGAFFLVTSILLITLSVIYSIVVAAVYSKKLTNMRKQILAARFFWILYSAVMLTAAVFEGYEQGGLNNLIFLALAGCIIPLRSPTESAILNTSYYIVYGAAILGSGDAVYLLLQSLVICALPTVVSFFLYRSYVFSYTRDMQLAASNMELKKLNEELAKLSETDELTRVLNRRGMESRVGIIWELCLRDGKNMAVLMIDVDYFKSLNDRHGHMAGDICLTRVAQCIKNRVRRTTDIVARYGGDEFVVVLNNITAEHLLTLAKSILKNVEEMQWSVDKKQEPVRTTLSIGVSTLIPTWQNSFKDLLDEADRAMYGAKKDGCNCVCYQGKIYRKGE